jgi:parallel beta helix pectate lyase-like protein
MSCGRDSKPLQPLMTNCAVSPDSIDFGPTFLRQLRIREVVITNTGTAALPLHVRLIPPSPYFDLVFVDTTTFFLQPKATIRFTITYAPQTGGIHSTAIDLGAAACTKVACRGEGNVPLDESCFLEPEQLLYPWARVGDAVDRTFVIRNRGTLPLSGIVGSPCGPFSVTMGAGPYTLGPNDSLQVTVRFQPSGPGVYNCSLSLGSGPCGALPCQGVGFRGRSWYIKPDGSGDAPSIQAGIDSAFDRDTILVAPGTYFEDIDFEGKGVVVKSAMGADETILDGTGQDSSVVIFKHAEPRSAVLEGFTITNGYGTNYEGGAIYCPTGSPTIRQNRIVNNHAVWGGAMLLGPTGAGREGPFPSPVIEDNVFESNAADHGGGAIMAYGSEPTIRGNYFKRNAVVMEGDGAAIHLRLAWGGSAIVEDNVFVENVAGDQGGGVFAYTDNGAGPVTIEGNLFLRNVGRGDVSAPSDLPYRGTGGAIATGSLYGSISHNTIVGNTSLPDDVCSGGGIRLLYASPKLDVSYNIIADNVSCGVVCREGGSGTFGPNILWNNSGVDLDAASCPPTWEGQAIISDPLFCSPETDDYRVAENSPALAGAEYFGAFSNAGCGPKVSP